MKKRIIIKVIVGILFVANFNLQAQQASKNRRASTISMQDALNKRMVELKITGAFDPKKLPK